MSASAATRAFTLAVAAAASLVACSPTSTAPQSNSSDRRQSELGAITPRRLVDELEHAGLPAPNPMDTTAAECRSTPCLQSIVTDTVRIKSFSTTAQAQIFAADRGLFQVATVVVSFAPPLTPAEQQRYRAAIPELILR